MQGRTLFGWMYPEIINTQTMVGQIGVSWLLRWQVWRRMLERGLANR